MPGARRIALVFLALFPLGAALAQPPAPAVESVTVNGRRVPDDEIRDFVDARAVATFKLGKVARWETGLCPTVMGLSSDFTKFVLKRVKDVATKVGAPLDGHAACSPNVQIVFTTTPQALLDNIAKNYDALLGYHDSAAQAEAMAKVTHPIQAWYSTQTIDVRGAPHFDGGKIPGIGCLDPPRCRVNLTRAGSYAVSGTRLNDGLRSGFHDVIIVVEPKQLAGYEIGALADYIAFLALAQPRSLDDCQQLPTILNLLAAGCSRAGEATQISDSDIGYLRGLYHMTGDAGLATQQNEIAFQLKQTLAGK